MKNLLITPVFPPVIGGPATYTWELSQRLDDTEVVAFGDEGVAHMVRVRRGWLRKLPLIGSFVRQLDLACKLLKYGRKADLWYIQGPLVVGVTASLLGKLLGKRMLMKFVGDISWETASRKGKTDKNLDEFLESGGGGILRSFQRGAFRRVAGIVVPSEYLRDVLVNYYFVPLEKVHVIYNAVDVPDVSEKAESRSEKTIVTVGRLVPHKNIAGIIEAVSMLDGYKLRVVGEGPEGTRLRELARELDVDVDFLGSLPREETLQEIANASVFVLYSNYEGLPHTIVEAMYLRTPVVASDILGTTEVATDGTATLAEANNPEDLAEKIKVFENKTEAAHHWVSTHFNWKQNLSQLEGLFSCLCQK